MTEIERVPATVLARKGVRRLLAQAQGGKRMIVTWNGTPMAMLGPITGTPIDPTLALEKMSYKTTQ